MKTAYQGTSLRACVAPSDIDLFVEMLKERWIKYSIQSNDSPGIRFAEVHLEPIDDDTRMSHARIRSPVGCGTRAFTACRTGDRKIVFLKDTWRVLRPDVQPESKYTKNCKRMVKFPIYPNPLLLQMSLVSVL
jgi:hypothetical protein